jgi:hypothetical protein
VGFILLMTILCVLMGIGIVGSIPIFVKNRVRQVVNYMGHGTSS